jgi:hypothetical protein
MAQPHLSPRGAFSFAGVAAPQQQQQQQQQQARAPPRVAPLDAPLEEEEEADGAPASAPRGNLVSPLSASSVRLVEERKGPPPRAVRSQSVTSLPSQRRERLSLDEFKSSMEGALLVANENRVTLNVGGRVFVTSRSTLARDRESMLAALVSGVFPVQTDGSGALFIDRDPEYFGQILNFLRDGVIDTDANSLAQNRALLREARFYQVRALEQLLDEVVRRESAVKRSEPSEEKVYKLLTHVETERLSEVFSAVTMGEGYDFESWLRADGAGHHLLFSKKLSRGELMLLDRLTHM